MEKLHPLLFEHRFPTPIRYLLAASIMFVCAALQAGLQAQSGFTGFFLLLPGVFLSGLLFDHGSSLFAACIALVCAAYLSYAGEYGIDFLVPCGLFAITAAGVAVVAEMMRAEIKGALKAQQTQRLLLDEMAHRTKNNLAILGAMIWMQARNGEPAVASALEGTARRIQVMAEVYDHLSPKEDSRLVDMRRFLSDVVEKVFQSLAPSGPVAFQVVCEEAHLPNQQALAIGIVANELVTNALKYAFPDQRSGQIVVELTVMGKIELSVRDNGIGLARDQQPKGLGSRIVALLTQQLGGTLSYERRDAGVMVVLRAPLHVHA
ncbi:ATP-binding protein [Bradyrhizobium diazoefficiens]|nr:histidine kinase dimerization/phosphoacceptor domain -containing protein [Bradyrhizobium diazoefficiens]QQO20628.1 ATP-binding protein [Bradyrhizobium diazoefficiens]